MQPQKPDHKPTCGKTAENNRTQSGLNRIMGTDQSLRLQKYKKYKS